MNSEFDNTNKFNRDIELLNFNKKQINQLDDRGMFNKFSNPHEDIYNDTSNVDILSRNKYVSNNRKNTLSKPYINDITQEKNKFTSILTNNINSSFEQIGDDIEYNDNNNLLSYNNTNIKHNNICEIESNINNVELHKIKSKYVVSKNLICENYSTFALSYLWKILLLISKNPTSEKILSMFNKKNKNMMLMNLENDTKTFINFGSIIINLNLQPNSINSKLLQEYVDKYNLTINEGYEFSDVLLNYGITLSIPKNYAPKIVNNYLLNFNKFKIKFIELSNVEISLDIIDNIVYLEIPLDYDIKLGFTYQTNRILQDTIDLELMSKTRILNKLINKLTIPKINITRNQQYEKNFEKILNNFHIGELLYGNKQNLQINTEMYINFETSKNIKKSTYIKDTYSEINLNHPSYYYIKLNNQILMNGVLQYE